MKERSACLSDEELCDKLVELSEAYTTLGLTAHGVLLREAAKRIDANYLDERESHDRELPDTYLDDDGHTRGRGVG